MLAKLLVENGVPQQVTFPDPVNTDVCKGFDVVLELGGLPLQSSDASKPEVAHDRVPAHIHPLDFELLHDSEIYQGEFVNLFWLGVGLSGFMACKNRLFTDADVVGLEISMNITSLVNDLERVHDLAHHAEHNLEQVAGFVEPLLGVDKLTKWNSCMLHHNLAHVIIVPEGDNPWESRQVIIVASVALQELRVVFLDLAN